MGMINLHQKKYEELNSVPVEKITNSMAQQGFSLFI